MNDNTTESNDDDKDRLLSMGEAAKLYGFSRFYMSRIAKSGRLKAQKVGGRWLTTPANVETYIRSRKEKGAYRDDIQIDD